MKQSPEAMIALCDALMGNPSHTNACSTVGISIPTFYRWLKASSLAPDDWMIDYMETRLTFHEAVRLATKVYKTVAHSEFEARATGVGRKKKLYFGGKAVWLEDERIIAAGDGDKDPATLLLLYGQPDIFLRDKNGNRVQADEEITSDAQTLAWLRKNYPAYNDRRELAVDGHINLGVTTIPMAKHAAPLVAPAAVPQIAQPEIVQDDADQDADLEEVVGSKPAMPVGDFDPFTGIARDARSKPVTKLSDTDPPERVTDPDPILAQTLASPPPRGEMSELRRDLLQRASQPPKNPHPKGIVEIGHPGDERIKG